MWPLCVISDKLSKMIGDGGGDEEEEEEEEEGKGGSPADSLVSFAARSHFVDVPHVRQLFNWDCGLACVLMVLRALGIECCDIHDLEKLCSTTSIWTVDLAFLLHKFSVNFSFFTVTLGVNPNYSAETFYREQLEDDTSRVGELFEKALEAGISIQCRSISSKDISILLLSGHCIAVALVDKITLGCMMYVPVNATVGGHYIVICGYDANAGEFEIRDPASSRKHERVSMECLDEARKSFGTDEDILLVSLSGKDGNKISSHS